MRVVAVVPAYQAEATVGQVVTDLRREWPREAGPHPVVVVDDGSTDQTAERARTAGADLVRHEGNRGKGAALRTGLRRALELEADVVVTVDADGQHPASEAVRLAEHPAPADALLLAVRDLARDNAPRANRFSNGLSNFFLSCFTGIRLRDTQCGLRRYPVAATIALQARDTGYAYEAEVVLRAARAGLRIDQEPVRVIYPPPEERVSHFQVLRDPGRIIFRVLYTLLVTRETRPGPRRVGLGFTILVGLLAAAFATHVGIGWVARPEPPAVSVPAGNVDRIHDGLRVLGSSYALDRGKLLEIGLVGTAPEIGFAQARLLRDPMQQIETALYTRLRERIAWSAARALILDLAQLRYRDVDRGMSLTRRQELAAMAQGMAPDPHRDFFPTYQRLIYLHALYDISLSFEHSPLIGCTSFVLRKEESAGGALLARNFDFEVDEIFDRRKAVMLVREDDAIPFASVAWPGLAGVVSGMNAEGLAVVVHGARAGEPRTIGEPVVHALRRVLARARTTDEAVTLLGERPALVSHLVIVVDARGRGVTVERLPGRSLHTRPMPARAVVTNHFEGPAAGDPKNQHVREHTSTLARRERGEELVAALTAPPTPRAAIALLRDRRAVGGGALPLGDRRAIDALIATHGVVMDTGARVLWVSESPHLLGRFIGFDLAQLLAPGYDPRHTPAALRILPEDPLLSSGEYARWGAARGD